MATKAMWEVDPETRSKLAQIQKRDGLLNDRCCDCGAPSPQWASPKFSTFICLQCAGTHRGLGVHVSFVRSISMDAFKQNEILRMQYGGNKIYQGFFTKHSSTTFEDTSIKDRYDCEVGEEWKERLSAQVDERPFDKIAWQKERAIVLQRQASRSATPATGVNSTVGLDAVGRSASPAPGKLAIPAAQKAKNEAYFQRMGDENASRSADLLPSQGGRYAGFGSSVEPQAAAPSAIPSTDEFQKDPVAALTKGLGWFGAALTKQVKTVNDSYIQPTAKTIVSSDIAAQARSAALAAGQGIQTGMKGAADNFNKFVDGQDEKAGTGAGRRQVEPEKKDFWDSFGQPSEAVTPKPSNIGTSAMKGTGGEKKKEDGWGTNDW